MWSQKYGVYGIQTSKSHRVENRIEFFFRSMWSVLRTQCILLSFIVFFVVLHRQKSLLQSLRIMLSTTSPPSLIPSAIYRGRIIIIIIIVFLVSISTRYNISLPVHHKNPQASLPQPWSSPLPSLTRKTNGLPQSSVLQ